MKSEVVGETALLYYKIYSSFFLSFLSKKKCSCEFMKIWIRIKYEEFTKPYQNLILNSKHNDLLDNKGFLNTDEKMFPRLWDRTV